MAISEKDQAILDSVKDTDEPIFIFRGKDVLSPTIISLYRTQFERHGPTNLSFTAQITKRLREFEQWQQNNTHRVKYPD